MTSDDWHHGARSVTLWLNGDMDDVDQRGEPVGGATLIVCCNLGDASIDWRLPDQRWGAAWHPVLDTSNAAGPPDRRHAAGDVIGVMGRSVMVLEQLPA
jgi:glycogen operon protein